jgi:hypothetical protein
MEGDSGHARKGTVEKRTPFNLNEQRFSRNELLGTSAQRRGRGSGGSAVTIRRYPRQKW